MTKEQLKPIIDEILKYYINRKTRIMFDSKIQENMIAHNKGIINACSAVIGFCDDRDLITVYTKSKIAELNNGEEEHVMMEVQNEYLFRL